MDATLMQNGLYQPKSECVAEEVAIAIEVNGIAYAVMLATPADLDDFALGFLLGEGLIGACADLLDVEAETVADGIALRITVVQRCLQRLKARRRALAGVTGCGLCGQEALQSAIRPVTAVSRHPEQWFDAAALTRGMAALTAAQTLKQATGATHAAAWLDTGGGLVLLREDVGRHNALDKLIGASFSHPRTTARATGFVAVTSRASYEMVHKAASAGFGLLVAASAPTSLAVGLAIEAGLTLVGFARADRATVYSHPQRLLLAPPARAG